LLVLVFTDVDYNGSVIRAKVFASPYVDAALLAFRCVAWCVKHSGETSHVLDCVASVFLCSIDRIACVAVIFDGITHSESIVYYAPYPHCAGSSGLFVVPIVALPNSRPVAVRNSLKVRSLLSRASFLSNSLPSLSKYVPLTNDGGPSGLSG